MIEIRLFVEHGASSSSSCLSHIFCTIRIERDPVVSTYTLIPAVPPISSSFRSPVSAHKKAHSANRCAEQCNCEACSHIANREKDRHSGITPDR